VRFFALDFFAKEQTSTRQTFLKEEYLLLKMIEMLVKTEPLNV
jgi:hypothetical protein